MALNASVGSSSANSYATVAEADAYFSTDYGTTFWSALDQPTKEALLITATRLADTYIEWNGYKYGEGSLRWPRARAPQVDSRQSGFASVSSDGDSTWLRYFPTDVVPTRVKEVVYEIARYLQSIGGDFNTEPNDIDSVKVASITVSFVSAIQTAGFPQRVKDLLFYVGVYVGSGAGSIKQVRVSR